MICVVLPAAHSAPDFFYFFFICLRRDRNYSALHRFFCCTLNWIFFPPPLVQSTLLTFNICFWSRGRLSHLFTRPLADFSERYGSRKVSRQRFWKRPPPSFFKPVYPPPHVSFSSQMLVTEGPVRHSCISSPPLSSSRGTVQRVIILCRVNTEFGLYMWGNWCEINISANTTPPEPFCDQLFMYCGEPRNYI